MNEIVQVPDDVDIDSLDFSLDSDFKSLDQEIRSLLKQHSSLHPRHKNDVGQFPGYRAILTPAPNSSFTQEPPRRYDPQKIKNQSLKILSQYDNDQQLELHQNEKMNYAFDIN